MSDLSQPHAVFETIGDGIARIRINRPERLGAYAPRRCAEIPAAIRQTQRDDSPRGLILAGSGRGFCTGGAWVFPRVMGYDRAFRMVALAEIYDATTSLELGLATEVVADEELESRTLELAERLANAAPRSSPITRRWPTSTLCCQRPTSIRSPMRLPSRSPKAGSPAAIGRRSTCRTSRGTQSNQIL